MDIMLFKVECVWCTSGAIRSCHNTQRRWWCLLAKMHHKACLLAKMHHKACFAQPECIARQCSGVTTEIGLRRGCITIASIPDGSVCLTHHFETSDDTNVAPQTSQEANTAGCMPLAPSTGLQLADDFMLVEVVVALQVVT